MRKSEWRKRLNKLVKDPKKVDQDVLYNWRNEARENWWWFMWNGNV